MNIDKQIEILKKISIRGRLAYGMKCLEQYVKENEINDELIDKVFDILWEFTTSDELDVWDEKISDFNPKHILNIKPEKIESEYPTITINEYYELKKFYENSDTDFISMIEKVIEIGTGNLYGGTDEYSSWTLEPTLEVIKMSELKLEHIPDITKFKSFEYSEDKGWGKKINRVTCE
ncbi:hypothetical protein [Psychroserpens sp. Hel_I_66]|uniref:hypothetical protein n=1 Tax=Psychroserpens sp. Hel_I_66 TaxID=1250004 RepID=UPI000647083E|nr:hypothetical protein [Psychroserpens sp. Hel_I_66]